jgi:hypothetical protein
MVCEDLVGPFKIRKPFKKQYQLVLTMIDTEMNHGLVETVEATNKSAPSIQDLFHNTWLAHYPRPQFILFENESRDGIKAIKAKPTTIHNH